MGCSEKAFPFWLTLLFPSSSPIFDICTPAALTEDEVLGHVVLICISDMHMFPLSYFSNHKAPYFLAVSMLLLVYFFLILSVPSCSCRVSLIHSPNDNHRGCFQFHHHTQQVSFVQKRDSNENDGWQPQQCGQGSEVQSVETTARTS